MSVHDESTPRMPRWAIWAVVALAIYLISYFPAFSYMARHPERRQWSAVYRPIPLGVRVQMLSVWKKLDPEGFEIVERMAGTHSKG